MPPRRRLYDPALEFNPDMVGRSIARLHCSHVETWLQEKKNLDFSAHTLKLSSSADPKYPCRVLATRVFWRCTQVERTVYDKRCQRLARCEHFFSEQNRRNKSSRFWLDCKSAKCFGHLNDVRSKLNDRELFQKTWPLLDGPLHPAACRVTERRKTSSRAGTPLRELLLKTWEQWNHAVPRVSTCRYQPRVALCADVRALPQTLLVLLTHISATRELGKGPSSPKTQRPCTPLKVGGCAAPWPSRSRISYDMQRRTL